MSKPFDMNNNDTDNRDEKKDNRSLYPEGFFDSFGSGNGLGFDVEPEDPVEDKHSISREEI